VLAAAVPDNTAPPRRGETVGKEQHGVVVCDLHLMVGEIRRDIVDDAQPGAGSAYSPSSPGRRFIDNDVLVQASDLNRRPAQAQCGKCHIRAGTQTRNVFLQYLVGSVQDAGWVAPDPRCTLVETEV